VREGTAEPPAAAEESEALAPAVRKVMEVMERRRHRGPQPSTEKPAVDWSSGEGRKRLQWKLRLGGVPDLYRDATLASCRVREAVEQYGESLAAKVEAGRGLMVFGPTGTGKSSTAALVAKFAVMADVRFRWTYVPDLCDQMMDGASRRQEVRIDQSAVDLLIWDDFGVRPLSAFEIGMLDQIVERRYQRRKPMIVTTNLTRDVMVKTPEFGRMVDRWRQMSSSVVISGKSMRTVE
jgi:DNA replication protein DnaC